VYQQNQIEDNNNLKTGPIKGNVKQAFLSAKPWLNLIEQKIISRLGSDAELLTKIPQYLLKQGGKRIRPLLCILSAKLFNQKAPPEEIIDVASGIELIHMATLLHDDIIDQSPTRRHQDSAYRRFGLGPSLLAGDFLLVRAFGLCAHLGSYVVVETEKACVELTEGEVLETKLTASNRIQFDEYERIVRKKTASLFALAMKLGAYLTNAKQEDILHVTEFGVKAGIAFQIIDDILDITADENLLGKPAGTDLRQRTPSLINVLWLESGDPRALDFFSKEHITEADTLNALSFLKTSEILLEARSMAKNYANKAISSLTHLDSNAVCKTTKNQLHSIVAYTLNRAL
jgi:geranylgeranyl pyrophosphate synthase